MRALYECRLYGIVDLGYVQESDVARVAEQMLEGGVDLIQLRGKARSIDELVYLAAELHQLTTKSSTPLIANDHAEIASQIPVEGVHVGQDDDSIEVARLKACRQIVVGKSTHNFEQALAAQREGADYGGINIDNLQSVIDAGAKRVVMVSALLNAHSIVDYARCATDMLA